MDNAFKMKSYMLFLSNNCRIHNIVQSYMRDILFIFAVHVLALLAVAAV